MNFEDAKVLLTGGAGSIGSGMVRQLMRRRGRSTMNMPLFKRLEYKPETVIPLSIYQRKALRTFQEKIKLGRYRLENAACICGGNDDLLIAERDRYGLHVRTVLCKTCGLLRTDPRLDEVSMEQFYLEDYRPIYSGDSKPSEVFFNQQYKQGQRIFEFIQLNMPPRTAPVIFDIGCGAGGTLTPFVEAGWKGIGCDTGEKYLELGRRKGLILENGGVDTLIKHGKADLVVLRHVLEHLPDPYSALRDVFYLLKSDGFLYIELPGIQKIHRTYGDLLLFLQNAHLYHFNLSTLHSVASKAGFTRVKGDEKIHALFRKGVESEIFPLDEYKRIISYLHFVEWGRFISLSIKQIKGLIWKITRASKGKTREIMDSHLRRKTWENHSANVEKEHVGEIQE